MALRIGVRNMYRYGYYMMTPGRAFPFGGLVSLIFWAVLISLVVGLLVHFFDNLADNKEERAEDSDSALEILKKRYTEGKITKKEFLEMKEDIV
jgi:putative membrane protein